MQVVGVPYFAHQTRLALLDILASLEFRTLYFCLYKLNFPTVLISHYKE